MPDLLLVARRRWRLLLLLTLLGTAAALLASVLSPKLYRGVTTALPVNAQVNDRARIFNSNIEALYSEIGTADELDKLEGTARLDTVFLAVAAAQNLPAHYGLEASSGNALEKAALLLRKRTDVKKTGYGELKISVWDQDRKTAASLANGLLQVLNAVHERLQTENNRTVLQKLKEEYIRKREQGTGALDSVPALRQTSESTEAGLKGSRTAADFDLQQTEKQRQLQTYLQLIGEYELAVKTAPKALLVVERARPSPWHDRPNTLRNVLIGFAASLLFAFLLAVFVERRNAGT